MSQTNNQQTPSKQAQQPKTQKPQKPTTQQTPTPPLQLACKFLCVKIMTPTSF